MKRSDFYYDLPEELIAQDPLEDRSSSRLLRLNKETGNTEHHIFKEVIDYLDYIRVPIKEKHPRMIVSVFRKVNQSTRNAMKFSENELKYRQVHLWKSLKYSPLPLYCVLTLRSGFKIPSASWSNIIATILSSETEIVVSPPLPSGLTAVTSIAVVSERA